MSIFYGILGVFGLLFIITGVREIRDVSQLSRIGRKTIGTVISVESTPDLYDEGRRIIRVRYRIPQTGTAYEATEYLTIFGPLGRLEVSQPVTILYDPKHPDNILIEPRVKSWWARIPQSYFSIGIGLIMALVAIFLGLLM